MGDEQKGVKVPVETTFDGTGTNQAAAAFRGAKAEAETTNKAFADLGDQAEKLKTQLVELAAFATIVEQFREGWNEAKNLAAEFRMLDMAAARTGDSAKQVRQEVKELAEELKKSSGTAESESIPAIVKLYREYGNMKDATNAARLAQAVAAAEFKGDFTQGMEAVHLAAVGNTRALKQMGIVIEDAKGAAEKGDAALKALAERARTATVDHSSLAYQMKAVNAELESVRLRVVESVKEVLPFIVSVAKTAFVALETGYKDLAAFVQGGIQVVVDAWGIVKKIASGESGAQIVASFKQLLSNVADVGKTVSDNHKQAAASVTAAWTKSAHDIADIGKGVVVPRALKDAKAVKEEYLRDLDAVKEEYLRDLDRREKANLKFHKNLRFMQQETTADLLRHFGIEETEEEKLHKNIRHLVQETLKKKKEAAKQEVQMNTMVANAVVGIGEEIFGASKETAIAHAIINTYQGAALAIATYPPPYGEIMAALTIALGLAQVYKIESTEPAAAGGVSGGFDDPSNDQMAYMTGRRWASDMTRKISDGWSDGLSLARPAASQVTNNYDNSRRTTINANIQDPTNIEAVKKLIRTMRMVDSNILGRTTIAARTS